MNSIARQIRTGLLTALCAAAPWAARAASPDSPPEHARRPPVEALQACKSLAAAAPCSFQTPSGKTVSGSCWAPEGLPLACKPAHMPPPDADGLRGGPHGAMPPAPEGKDGQ